MSRGTESVARLPVRRLVAVSIAFCPVVLFALVAIFWALDHAPDWFWWKTALVTLIAIEIAYALTLALAAPAAIVLGFLVFATRKRPHRSSLGRWCLLCVSLIGGMIATETVCAAWRYRSHRSTVAPAGEARSLAALLAEHPHAPRDPSSSHPSTVSKEDDAIDIVVLGESSAEGVPFAAWVSIGRIVCWQLEQVMPARAVHLWSFAVSGATLERQEQRLREATLRPDAVIIYCGHNELSSRFAASRAPTHYLDDQRASIATILIDWIERTSPACRLISETAEKCRVAIPPARDESRPLVDVPVYTPTEYAGVLLDFRRRLDAMVSYIEQQGAIPVLIVPSSNDAGFEPNRSFLPPETPRQEREEFARDFLAARRREAEDPAGSLELYRKLLARQPTFAETHFRIARLLERASRWDEAYDHFISARDLDGFPIRMQTQFQDAYRETAARHRCILIDGQAYFHAIGNQGMLDDHLFQDGMHPSFRGQIALAQAVLQELHARRALDWPAESPPRPIDPAQCALHFNLGPDQWRMVCLWSLMFGDLTCRIRYDASERLEMKKRYAAAALEIAAGAAPEAVGLSNVGIPPPVPVVPTAAVNQP
jgi:lysophospholipase L1-like esterase